jgi:hypothetical protein
MDKRNTVSAHLEQGLCPVPASVARSTTVSVCARNIETSNTHWNFQWSEVGNLLPTALSGVFSRWVKNFRVSHWMF